MKEKLIIIDLDGTTLNSQGTLSEENIQAIHSCLKQNHKVAIATGRPWRLSKDFYRSLNLTTPIINYNGSHIHHPSDKNFAAKYITIDRKRIFECLELLKDYLSNAICEYKDDVYLEERDDEYQNFFTKFADKVVYGKISNTLDINPFSLMIILKDKKYLSIVKDLLKSFPDFCSRFWNMEKYQLIVEINPVGVNKYQGVLDICKYYSIPTENVIAFGDADNDIELLSNSFLSFAMKNATESAKKSAKKITKYSNDEHGVAKELYELFK